MFRRPYFGHNGTALGNPDIWSSHTDWEMDIKIILKCSGFPFWNTRTADSLAFNGYAGWYSCENLLGLYPTCVKICYKWMLCLIWMSYIVNIWMWTVMLVSKFCELCICFRTSALLQFKSENFDSNSRHFQVCWGGAYLSMIGALGGFGTSMNGVSIVLWICWYC